MMDCYQKTLSDCVLLNTESKIHTHILDVFTSFYRVETGRTLSVCVKLAISAHICINYNFFLHRASGWIEEGIVRFGDGGGKRKINIGYGKGAKRHSSLKADL